MFNMNKVNELYSRYWKSLVVLFFLITLFFILSGMVSMTIFVYSSDYFSKNMYSLIINFIFSFIYSILALCGLLLLKSYLDKKTESFGLIFVIAKSWKTLLKGAFFIALIFAILFVLLNILTYIIVPRYVQDVDSAIQGTYSERMNLQITNVTNQTQFDEQFNTKFTDIIINYSDSIEAANLKYEEGLTIVSVISMIIYFVVYVLLFALPYYLVNTNLKLTLWSKVKLSVKNAKKLLPVAVLLLLILFILFMIMGLLAGSLLTILVLIIFMFIIIPYMLCLYVASCDRKLSKTSNKAKK